MTPPQKLQAHTPHGPPQTLTLGKEIGRGGEGTVHLLPAPHQKFVAKIYHPGQGNENKIKAMLTTPPQSTAVAWPQQILYNDRNEFIGYTMPLLNQTTFRPWLEFAHTQQRRKTAPQFDVKYALATAQNVGTAITSLHKAGHIIGDLNESNLFVRQDTHVYIIDTDSAQITTPTGQQFPCEVGKPEYTAPELIGRPFKETTRTPATDTYAYAILIFQILTGGAHPTDGKWPPHIDPPTIAERIKNQTYPSLIPHPQAKPLDRVAADAIPTQLRHTLTQALHPNPQQRATIKQLTTTLAQTITRLQQCTKTPTHWWDSQDQHCLWCARTPKPDPWATTPTPTPQISLPALTFQQQTPTQTPQKRPRQTIQPNPTPNHHHQPRHYTTNPAAPRQHRHHQPTNHTRPTGPAAPPKKTGLLKPKTLVTDAHGNTRTRPALSTLFALNPKLAIQSLKNEWPHWANPIWPRHHTIKPTTAILAWIATLLGLAPTAALIYTAHHTLPPIFTTITAATIGLTSTTAALTLLITATIPSRTKHPNPKPLTLLTFTATPLIWGPILWAAILYQIAATFTARIRLENAGYH